MCFTLFYAAVFLYLTYYAHEKTCALFCTILAWLLYHKSFYKDCVIYSGDQHVTNWLMMTLINYTDHMHFVVTFLKSYLLCWHYAYYAWFFQQPIRYAQKYHYAGIIDLGLIKSSVLMLTSKFCCFLTQLAITIYVANLIKYTLLAIAISITACNYLDLSLMPFIMH